jgi:hypothetical protein
LISTKSIIYMLHWERPRLMLIICTSNLNVLITYILMFFIMPKWPQLLLTQAN